MAMYSHPYRFKVYDTEFDATFECLDIPLERRNPYSYNFHVTLAFARKVNGLETLAAKSILNPKDRPNYLKGQKVAFDNMINAVWAHWTDAEINRKEFVKLAWQISFDAGMWD